MEIGPAGCAGGRAVKENHKVTKDTKKFTKDRPRLATSSE